MLGNLGGKEEERKEGMAQNGQGIEPAVLDDIINRLLDFRIARTARQVQLSEAEIRSLCSASREIFLQQPNLLELEAPIKICGTPFPLSLLSSFQFCENLPVCVSKCAPCEGSQCGIVVSFAVFFVFRRN